MEGEEGEEEADPGEEGEEEADPGEEAQEGAGEEVEGGGRAARRQRGR